MRSVVSTLVLALLATPPLAAQSLSPREREIRAVVQREREQAVSFLQKVVDINSGTLNLTGVRAVGDAFARELGSLGFETRWVALPDSLHRAGHLVAEHRGARGKRLLLIGHLDTVFEGEGKHFVRVDSIAHGAGTNDIKGGDVAILYALRALKQAGALDGAQITVVMTGDEESPGEPLAVSRAALIDAAKRSDLALAFEGGSLDNATIARRGASFWTLTVTGKQGHSSGIFGDQSGAGAEGGIGRGASFGAVYEAARILDEFRRTLPEQYLSFNPGVIAGGERLDYETTKLSGTVGGKLNIIAPKAVVQGDLRFITEEQKERTRSKMREIVAKHLPGTSAEITFADGYPAMSPTAGNRAILAQLDTVSRALGYGSVAALDPGRRGAGDISFVAPFIDGLDGLGVSGRGAHSPDEDVNLESLHRATERAALLIYRLTQAPRAAKVAQ